MRKSIPCITVLTLMINIYAPLAIGDDEPALDTAAIEAASGLKGTFNKEENVFKVSKARTDVAISVDDWKMPAFMGLTSWAAFTPAHDGTTMMMGDTVLFEDEVNPAMSVALENGLDVTALHNHFFYDEPKIYFMHIGGMGNAGTLATGVKKIYDKIAEIRRAHPQPQKAFDGATISASNSITAAPIEAALAITGQAKDGMFKIVIGRPATMHGTPVGKEMGINTWAAFAGSDDAAVVDGDFAMTENELQTVLKAMRKGGINIVAIHQHMVSEEPRILFLHYWAKGKAAAVGAIVEGGAEYTATYKIMSIHTSAVGP
ncbi:DUF1259 domain-containing protein [Hyphomicrobium sp. 99]|uniref:DUF1259 domain-containing protein n=1 Tax=Hyphomicrobium sp. 99 TaxID=1163419 RepID=UPI0006966CDB|nr:DUF1259 domain-containing protein [Hyphomicrobium sp. 99]